MTQVPSTQFLTLSASWPVLNPTNAIHLEVPSLRVTSFISVMEEGVEREGQRRRWERRRDGVRDGWREVMRSRVLVVDIVHWSGRKRVTEGAEWFGELV